MLCWLGRDKLMHAKNLSVRARRCSGIVGYCLSCTMAVGVVTATEFLYFNDSVVLEQNFAGEAGEIFAWAL